MVVLIPIDGIVWDYVDLYFVFNFNLSNRVTQTVIVHHSVRFDWNVSSGQNFLFVILLIEACRICNTELLKVTKLPFLYYDRKTKIHLVMFRIGSLKLTAKNASFLNMKSE